MSRFFIVSGDDDFARKQRARELASGLCRSDAPENDPSVEIIPGDAPELKAEQMALRFLDALRTPPFLCEKKVIWMRHHPDLELFTADKLSPAMSEVFAILSAPLPDEIDVLIDGPGVDRRRTRFKELKNAGAEVEIFNAAKASDRNFAENRHAVLTAFAKSSGKRIAHDALQYLSEAIGGDSGLLANELEKLRCYTGNVPEITLEDCRAIVSRTQEALSWEFTSCVVSGDRARALLTLGTLLSQRENGLELRMMAALSGEYQRMIQTRLAMKELNISRPYPGAFDSIPPDIKAQFPANPLLKLHPYRAFKVCEAACKFSGGELAEKLTLIRNVSRALVSGGGNSRILLEQLVCKLCKK